MNIRRIAAAAAIAAGLVAGPALAAQAITGGQPDGEGHPNVALIAFYDATGRFRCTASLVSPTVLVTAAHCTDGTLGKTAVTFDTHIADAPPSPLPTAADITAGYTSAELKAAGYYSGTAHTHPAYSDFTDLKNWNDVGVIVLDEPITSIAPVKVAPSGFLNQFTPNVLNQTLFTSVGYGTEVRQAATGPKKPTPQSYPLLRRVTDEKGQKLTPQILQVNGNENDPFGGGGTCFGDSGGPTFKGGYQVTVTSYGYTSNCRYLGGLQRIDIPVVQTWLAEFGVAPAA
ncbi:pterin-4-alpha-carbinolamine dehydratase [Janibacter sp. HTCC2649]|uniref:trypsin-like serine protease n=1 Tax=Janibacter sp. HTCC2649 TaxID=313589 RepID=UPI00006709A0|nr:trypsin-like serine protease [Janibacter sp. HTCC2649]EAQ00063.1 pterin-4-alpha-carbinolamine dehydratase [Janibacter sp. HTCC2649]